MKLLFLGNLATGEMILIGLLLLLLPIVLILFICGAFRSFPPDPQTTDRSKWAPITMKIWNGVVLYLIADIIGSIFYYLDKVQDIRSILSITSSPEDLFKAWTNNIDILSGSSIANVFVIIGYLMYYTGLGQFSVIHQDNTTNYKITRIRTATLLGIVAIVLDYIPLIGSVASWIVNLIMYSTLASTFSYLKFSPVFNTKAKAGASLLQNASIMYIIGMCLPLIGNLFNLFGFLMTFIGWGRMANGGPISFIQTMPSMQPPAPEPDPHTIFCTKCGTRCTKQLKYCPHCGFALQPEREEQTLDYPSYAPPRIIAEPPKIDSYKKEKENREKEMAIPTAASPKKPIKPSPISSNKSSSNKRWIWILTFVVVLTGLVSAYLLWYNPYAIDRDAPRYYTFTNLNLRSSEIADVEHNIVKLLPYGTELITYSVNPDWASVKTDGEMGFVASNLILSSDDFALLNSTWGNTDAKECIGMAKCRLAILDYYKRFQLSGGAEWQIYTRRKEDQTNTVYYRRFYNPNSKFTDFAFIAKNNRTKDRELVIYSFDDDTEKPIYRINRHISSEGYIKSINSSEGWINVLFTDGEWTQIPISGQ